MQIDISFFCAKKRLTAGRLPGWTDGRERLSIGGSLGDPRVCFRGGGGGGIASAFARGAEVPLP